MGGAIQLGRTAARLPSVCASRLRTEEAVALDVRAADAGEGAAVALTHGTASPHVSKLGELLRLPHRCIDLRRIRCMRGGCLAHWSRAIARDLAVVAGLRTKRRDSDAECVRALRREVHWRGQHRRGVRRRKCSAFALLCARDGTRSRRGKRCHCTFLARLRAFEVKGERRLEHSRAQVAKAPPIGTPEPNQYRRQRHQLPPVAIDEECCGRSIVYRPAGRGWWYWRS